LTQPKLTFGIYCKKKLTMKKIFTYLLICLLFINMKCEDTEDDYLPAGIETRIFGNIYDNFNDLPVANQKMIIAEYRRDWGGGGSYDAFVQELDSIISDENGNFDFVFETGGMGTKYKIYPRHNPSIWTGYEGARDIENIGEEEQTDFNYTLLTRCTLIININNVDFSPFPISIFPSQNYDTEDITETNGMAERVVYLFPNSDETLFIGRTLDNGIRETATFLVPASNSLEDRIFEVALTNDDFE